MLVLKLIGVPKMQRRRDKQMNNLAGGLDPDREIDPKLKGGDLDRLRNFWNFLLESAA